MKNSKDTHTAAAAELDKLQSAIDNLFAEADAEGHGAPASNELWAEKYQSRYNALERQLDAVARVYWYTAPDVCRNNKQITHRVTVADMRAKGRHKMSL